MNEFARFGMTEYFKQGMAKGASIGLQKTGTNFITRKERSETPLDVALHYDQQPIIDLIKAEIKKEVEKMILETILETRLQKKEILTLDDFSELDRRIKKTVDSKFGHCKTDIANCYVAVTRTETQLELFLDMQEASIAANEALDAIILGDKNFRFTKKLLNTVINSMRKIFGYREFSGIEDILNDIAHQIIGMKKRELLRPVAKATQSQQPIAAADTFILLDDVELAEILKPLETSVLQGVVSPISADKANVLKGTVAPANPYSFLDGLTDFDRQQIVTLDTLDDAQRAEILELLIKTSILQSVVSPIIPADEANTRKGTVASANPYSFLGGLTDFGRQQKDLEAARRAVPAISSAAPAAKAHPTPSNAHEEEMAIVKKLRVPNSALFVLPAAPKLAATPSADESDEELKEFSKVIA